MPATARWGPGQNASAQTFGPNTPKTPSTESDYGRFHCPLGVFGVFGLGRLDRTTTEGTAVKLNHRIKRWLGIASPSGQYPPPGRHRASVPPKLDIAAGPLTGYRSISQQTPCDVLCGLFPHPDYRTTQVPGNGRQRPYDGQCRGNCASAETMWTVGPNNELVPPLKGCDGC